MIIKNFIILSASVFLILSGCNECCVGVPNENSKEIYLDSNNMFNKEDAFNVMIVNGDINEAIGAFEEKVKIDTNDAESYSRLAMLYLMNRQYKEGFEALRNSIFKDEENYIARNSVLKAFLFYEFKNSDSADVYFRALGTNNILTTALVQQFISIKDFEKAKEYNDLILRFFPLDEEANLKAAVDLYLEGQKEKAIETLTRLCNGSKNAKLYATRAMFYHNMKKYALALSDENIAVKMSNGEAWILAGRGRTKQKMGDYNGAKEDYNLAIQKGDTTALRYYNSLLEELN